MAQSTAPFISPVSVNRTVQTWETYRSHLAPSPAPPRGLLVHIMTNQYAPESPASVLLTLDLCHSDAAPVSLLTPLTGQSISPITKDPAPSSPYPWLRCLSHFVFALAGADIGDSWLSGDYEAALVDSSWRMGISYVDLYRPAFRRHRSLSAPSVGRTIPETRDRTSNKGFSQLCQRCHFCQGIFMRRNSYPNWGFL